MERLSLILAATLALAGCGDSGNPVKPDGSTKYDGIITQKDGIPPGENVVKPDGTVKPDGPGVASALQAVVNTMTMPKSEKDYAYDFEGKGTKKNALGKINGVLLALPGMQGFDFQSNLDNMVKAGEFLMLFDVQAKSISDDAAMKLQAFQGQDLDTPPNAADNFSGTEQFGVTGSPMDLILDGKIAASKLSVGPGSLVIPIPASATPTAVKVEKTRIEATLSSTPMSAMTAGVINGVIPWTEVDQKIIPQIAEGVDATYKASTTPQATKDMLKTTFDANKDGTITADEIRNNLVLKLVLAPDVDTNNDGTLDALSVGLGFTGVTCTIKK